MRNKTVDTVNKGNKRLMTGEHAQHDVFTDQSMVEGSWSEGGNGDGDRRKGAWVCRWGPHCMGP